MAKFDILYCRWIHCIILYSNLEKKHYIFHNIYTVQNKTNWSVKLYTKTKTSYSLRVFLLDFGSISGCQNWNFWFYLYSVFRMVWININYLILFSHDVFASYDTLLMTRIKNQIMNINTTMTGSIRYIIT